MMPVKNVMTTQVITVRKDTPIYEALELLKSCEISGLPVIDDQDRIVGILSEKDVLRILIDDGMTVNKRVEDYMSKDVISFQEKDCATEVCKFFVKSHIRRVPILRDGKIVGIVSRRDIVSLILDARSRISEFRYS